MIDFRDLDALHAAHDLVVEIYDISQSFPEEDGFGVSQAITGTAMAIPRAIASGCGNGTTDALAESLRQASARTSELEYLILLANETGLIDEETVTDIVARIEEMKSRLQDTLKDM